MIQAQKNRWNRKGTLQVQFCIFLVGFWLMILWIQSHLETHSYKNFRENIQENSIINKYKRLVFETVTNANSSSVPCFVSIKDLQIINIGFITDGNNLRDLQKVLKTLFLHRSPLDYLKLHIIAPKDQWVSVNELFDEWYQPDVGLHHSFNHTLYDMAKCKSVQDIFEPHFDSVYRTSFCKLIFPYLLDPFEVPYLLFLDFDILILSNLFKTDCWSEAIAKLNHNALALFSIAHQGSPKGEKLPFPMPYLFPYKSHFHFNNGVVLFHVFRIHALDNSIDTNNSVTIAYPVSNGQQRWLRDLQQVTLTYLSGSGKRYSLTQVVWNIYMHYRPHSFTHLNQGCNFQPCAQLTNNQMSDDASRFPSISIVHIWRTCRRTDNRFNNFFSAYYQALELLPVHYVNRINPTYILGLPESM